MKPQFIKMKAFGSYRDERIDFSKVQQGLFLITGDTGAGKTTIFDAIMFALYGETSGGRRDGKMMRSQYASEDMVTEVQLGFSYQGQSYVIRRRPQQPRYKKEKETGTYVELKTQMPAKAELIMPDGKEFPGRIAQINEKIIQIIGLNADQFTQVAMLAQGDFMKLLLASSKDRKEIFAKIFDTKIYAYIQEELKQRSAMKAKELYGNRKDIVRELQEITFIEGSAYEAEWNSERYFNDAGEHFSESDPDGILDLIENMIEEAKEKEEMLDQKRKYYDKKLSDVHIILENAALMNRQFDRLEEQRQHQKELAAQAEEMACLGRKIETLQRAEKVLPFYEQLEEQRKKAKESRLQAELLKKRIEEEEKNLFELKQRLEQAKHHYEKEAPKLQIQISQIEKSLDQYDAFDKVLKDRKNAEKRVLHAQQQIRRLEGQIQASDEMAESLSLEIDVLRKNIQNTDVLEIRLKEWKRYREDLEEIVEALEEFKHTEQSCKKAEQALKKAKQEAETAEEIYAQYHERFLANQAVLLRAQLEVGKPCPVCGKIHEVSDVIVESDVEDSESIRSEVLKELSQRKETAERKRMAAQSEADIIDTKLKHQLSEGQKKLKKVFGEELLFEASLAPRIAEESIQSQKKMADLQKQIREAVQMKNDLEAKEVLLEQQKREKTESENHLKQIREQGESENRQLGIYDTQMTMLKAQLSFTTKRKAQQALGTLREELKKWYHEQQEAERNYSALSTAYAADQGELKKTSRDETKAGVELKKADAAFSAQLNKYEFQDRTEWEKFCPEIEQRNEYMERKQTYEQDVRETGIIIRELEISVKGKERIDISKYETEQQVLLEKRQKTEEAYGDLRLMVQNDQRAYEKVKALYTKRADMQEQMTLLADLSDTANGKIIGKQRINFQTYMQRRFFKNIIYFANKRLKIMSGDQFILQCRELENLGSGNAEVGLDLDVYSLVNQQSRDVKTLSGGESFIAALSMALGMADMIQNSSGNIHIETMFIDEGFGSLSEETRNQAIQILNELSEGKRLVGIISHVSELKQQVERQLIIQKTEKGSRHHWKNV